MLNRIHETHTFPTPLLPFILHRDMEPAPVYGMINWHTNLEILYIRSGNGYVLYDGQEIPLQRGDVVVVNTNCLHTFRSEIPTETTTHPFRYDCLIIDRNFCIQNGLDTNDCFFKSHFHDVVMEQKMDRIRAAWDIKAPNVVAVRAAVLDILAYLLQHAVEDLPPQLARISDKNRHIKHAIQHMEEHLSEPLSLTSTAQAIGISRYHLAHLFRQATGMSVISYIQLLRCRHAKVLLRQTDLSIAEVANECGFESVSYFDRCFVRLYGQTPRQVRTKKT